MTKKQLAKQDEKELEKQFLSPLDGQCSEWVDT